MGSAHADHGIGVASVLQLVELLLAFVATSVVLPALLRNHRRARRRGGAAPALFFSVAFSDWLFATVGVLHHIALLGQGGLARLTYSLPGVVLDAAFQLAFVATLLWPPLLACYALRDGSNGFFVRAAWQFAWVVAGAYGALWTRALQKERSPTHMATLRYVLSGVLGVSFTVVGGVAAVLLSRKAGVMQARRAVPHHKLIKYLVVTTALQLPFALAIWIGTPPFPRVVGDIAFCIMLLIPTLNAYNYGSPATKELMNGKRSRTRTGGATHTSVTEELIHTMDPENVALEELDGLSDMTFLAEGAAGSVYKARWLGIDVAMKLIKLPNAGDNKDLYQTIIHNSEAAFLAEASICARLRHPNITLFIRAGHYEGKLGILTEFCQRGSLKDVLKKEYPLAWKRKVALALHVAKGLTYLHARNPTYIHRDLKASNILVTDTWQAKLADFGISKVSNFVRGNGDAASTRGGDGFSDIGSFDPHTMTMRTLNESTSFAGTWRWNAPEVLRDPTNCRYSRSTDMYSFGMVLWEMLTDGAVPFSDVRFDFEVRERVLCEQRPQLRASIGCPDAFVELLTECWAQRPSARPTAPQAAAQLTLILENMGGKSLPTLESLDSGSDPSSLFTDRSLRSTFGRITNFFRGGGASGRRTSASQFALGSSRGPPSSRSGLGSSRGFAGSSRGFFFRSGGPVGNDDDDEPTNKFAMLGSPASTTSRSTRSSSSSSTGLGFHVGGSTRRRGFSRENALPSLHEYDAETSISDAPSSDAGMSPIVELPMDAMLEDGGSGTSSEDKAPIIIGDASSSYGYEEAAVRATGDAPLSSARGRGLTFGSERSGDSLADVAVLEPEYDELARTQPIKYPRRAQFPSASPAVGTGTGDASERLFV